MAIPIATGIMHLSGYEFQIEIAIAIGIESMGFGHEKSNAYRLLVILSRRGGRGYSVAESSATTEQNRLQSIPIAISISIPKIRRPDQRRHSTYRRAFVRLDVIFVYGYEGEDVTIPYPS
jgi:hypothetical protein